jgi:hypothetical protein
MWRIPSPLMAGESGQQSVTITTETYVGDLFTFLGSPTGKKDFTITVDGVDAGVIEISTSFTAGSTFTFVAINGGRFIGEAGAGGDGADDLGATGGTPTEGGNGGPAIRNFGTYPVSIDVDSGFLFGGGGGGGGGSYTDTGTGGDAGGGGGGGQGWTGGAGGSAGTQIGVPPPGNGTAGTRINAGAAGIHPNSDTSSGGAGGTWGLGGRTGRSSNILQGVGAASNFTYYGGLGGDAGRAYSGGNLTLSGAKSEATLRSEGRILGETGPNYLTVPSFSFYFAGFDIQPTNDNMGISFQSTGATLEVNTTISPSPSTQYYLTGGTGTGSDYQVRVPARTGDSDPSYWGNPEGIAGTWFTINTLRQWYQNFTGLGARASLFEMRRADIPGTTSTSDEVMASFYVRVIMESEP